MFVRRASKAIAVSAAALVCGVATLALTGTAQAGTGPGASGNTIPGAAAAQSPFTPGTFDSAQPIDVVVPANSILTPGATIFVFECAAPNGVNPSNTSSCDGNTGYDGGTISVNGDGSIDVTGGSAPSTQPYKVFALPDQVKLGEGPGGIPKCGLGAANECVLYIGQGGGGDPGMSQPHFFSQAFQVHPDPTDSGTLNPGDGTFPADSAPAITSANNTTFTKGTAGSFTVTGTGWAPPTFTETGALPTGVTLKTTKSVNSSSGTLAGTPTQSGTFPITIKASNGVAPDATQSFTLMVNSAPAITSANHTTFTQGTAGTFTVTATGVPTPTLAETGSLPGGVTFTPGTGVLAGTPTASGTFPITFTATNGVGSPASQSFTLTVTSSGTAPAITSANHATFTQGTAGSFTVTATGVPTPTLAESGALPAGVTFTPGTGVLAGTPSVTGTFPITFTATNGVGSPASQSFTLTVNLAGTPPTITSANSAGFTQGVAGSFTVTDSGSPTPTLAESGVLPAGVTFTPGTGALAGTPSVTGTFPITFTASNGVGSPATQSFTLTVVAIRITTTSLPAATRGTPYSATFQEVGGVAPFKWKKLSKLPKGLKLGKTGVLAGTVSAKVLPGNYAVTVSVTDKAKPVKNTATTTLTLTVN